MPGLWLPMSQMCASGSQEYEEVLKDLGINSPEQIWSGDKSGVQNVPKVELVIGATGTPAHQTVSGEQGETSTILSFVQWSW